MKTALIGIAWLVSVGCAFVIGTQIGAWQYVVSNASNDAVVASSRLAAIDAGRTEEVRATIDADLDTALARHADYLDSWFRWLFPTVDRDAERNIRNAARYRIAHPYEWPQPRAADADLLRKLEESDRELRRRVTRVLQRYGQ